MKKFNIPFLLVGLVLIVTLASCGMTQPGYGDEQYPDRTIRSRSIYSDPYYGGTQIVRDPYTGQYYEVTPVGPSYSYDPYGYGYPSSTYGRNPYYGRSSGGRYSTNSPRRTITGTTQQPPQRQQNNGSTTTQKAKDIIRGNR
jgi:hypothetical protein